MRVAAAVLMLAIAGCATPGDPQASPTTPAEMSAIVTSAERLTSIKGPWQLQEIRKGRFGDLWRGSTNDVTAQAPAAVQAKAALVVWRVVLSGPAGIEELYIDPSRGELVDSITQGE